MSQLKLQCFTSISMMLTISPSINDPTDLKTTVPVPFLTMVLQEKANMKCQVLSL